jgi:hypothetical protein
LLIVFLSSPLRNPVCRVVVTWIALWLSTFTLDARAASESIRDLYDAECLPLALPGNRELVDFDGLRENYSLDEYAGMPTGRIKIFNLPVFDPYDQRENNGFTRFVNRIHFPTRHYVIRRQILFKEGEAVDPRQISESERILRSNSFLSDAAVLPLQRCGDTIDLVVVVRDLWTLIPRFYISRTGGFTKYGLLLEDNNFLGSGDSLTLLFENDRERDTTGIAFATRNLFSSRVGLSTAYAETSDGFTRSLGIEKPFYALDTSTAYGVRFNENRLEESLQHFGQTLAIFDHRNNDYEVFAGYSPGLIEDFTRRYVVGYTYADDLFEPVVGVTGSPIPANRELAYPWFEFSLTEDAFAVYRNLNDIHRTEDVATGVQFAARLGIAGEDTGSELSRWVFSLQYRDSPLVSDGQLLRTRLALRGQQDRDSDVPVNTIGTIGLAYYGLLNRKQRLYAGLAYDHGRNLAADELLALGGDEGLRGYPSEFLLGDRRTLVNLEYRHFFDAHFLNIFRFAGVLFFDVGKTEGVDTALVGDSGWMKSTGLGLRMNSSKTNISRIVHFDLAFPLDEQDLVGDYEVRVFSSSVF